MKTAPCIIFLTLLTGAVLMSAGPSRAEKRIIIGGKNFTEQYILPEMAALLLEKSGFQVELRTGVGSTLLRKSLENGQVDLYFEYTGTAYTVYLKQKDREVMTDSDRVFEYVKETDARIGLVWLDRLGFNNTYTLMMRQSKAAGLKLASISDLASYVGGRPQALLFGMNAEFWERPDGFKQVMRTYGFRVPLDQVKKMATGLCYTALKEGQTDVSMGFSTDGRIAAFGFVNLKDDRRVFPVYNPAPVARREVAERWPEIERVLSPLSALTTREMQEINKSVDVDKLPARKAAKDWLERQGLP
ncbi:MAG: glycine/betaine ABC transporter substrate-binding protein [Proteobacteria bacterium]|nr:glycine/betaine ABC transporter substrate-binding protein [Pseudomonadota bacterium]